MQSKLDSALEALTNIVIGAVVALAAQYVWFPIIGYHLTHSEHLATTAFFTSVSFMRSYLLRRFFNGKSVLAVVHRKAQNLYYVTIKFLFVRR